MSAVPAVVIERQVYPAPFGLGLWDPVPGRLVSDGLAVDVARFVGGRARDAVAAVANRSGIFSVRRLPALAAFERGEPMAPVPHLVSVRDTLAQYLGVALRLSLPDARGLALPPCMPALWPGAAGGSPALAPAWVPLLASPAYTVPAGFASVRAACTDDANGAPAAGVVLEFHHEGRLLGRAVSDARGEALALFPYPEPPASPIFSPGSPPGPPTPAAPLGATRWPLDIVVRWRRDLPRYADDRGREPLPDLCELLAQPVAEAIEDGSPPIPLRESRLAHGETLVLPALRIRPA